MSDLFELSATLGLDTSEFVESINSARSTARQAQQELQQTFNQTSTATQQSANSAASALQNMFSFSGAQLLTSAIQTATSAIKTFATESISAASDLVEVQNVVDVTFGSSTDTINSWAKAAVNAYGLSETKAKQYTSTIGSMLKSMGIDGEEITQMSTDLAGLAADMASFYNLDYDEAFSKIRSGLSGETEPLKTLGINMSVANLEAYALAQGIDTAYDKMSQAEQATLRYQYLLEATEDAQGDFSRTSDSYSNEMRKLETNLERIKTDFGQGLLAVVTPAISMLNNALSDNSYTYTDVEQIMRTRNADLLENDNAYAYAEGILDSMEGMTDASTGAVTAADNWRNALEALLDVMPGLSKYVDLTTDAITGNTDQVDAYVKQLYNLNAYEAQKQALADVQSAYETAVSEYQAAQDAVTQRELKLSGQSKVDQNNLQSAWVTFANWYTQITGNDEWSEDAFVWGTDEASAMRDAYLTPGLGSGHSQYSLDQFAAGAAGMERQAAFTSFENMLDLWNNGGISTANDTELQELKDTAAAAEVAMNNAEAAYLAQKEVYEDFVASPEGASASLQSQFNDASTAEITAIDNVKTALTSLQEYYDATYNEILEKYRGTVTQFGYMVTYTEEEMEELLRTTYSQENVTSWWSHNADTMNTYVDQLEYLREQGVSDDILGNLTTWSKDNSALVARYWQMIMSGYSADDINADWENGQSAEERIAKFATELNLDNSPEYQALLDSAEEMVDAFNVADEVTTNLATTTDAVLMGIDKLNEQLQPKIAETKALLNSIFGEGAYTLSNGTAGLHDTVYTPPSYNLTGWQENGGIAGTMASLFSGTNSMVLRNSAARAAFESSTTWNGVTPGWLSLPNLPLPEGDVVADTVASNGKVLPLLGNASTYEAPYTPEGAIDTEVVNQIDTLVTAMELFNLNGSDNFTVQISPESVAEIAAAVQATPVSVENTFEVDGQAIAVQIAPMVSKKIATGCRYNIMTTKD